MNIHIILFIAFLNIACSQQQESNIPTRLMTTQELIDNQGEPDTKAISSIDSDSTMYKYDETTYQIKDDQVLMKFRAPNSQEKTIQFWRHKFASEVYKIESHNETEHTQDFKLIHPRKGLTIVFNERGTVLRIAQNGETLGESSNE